MQNLDRYRIEFPITERYTFMNHAAVSSPSQRVVDSVRSLHQEYSHCGTDCFPKWEHRINEVRLLFAQLIHAGPDEVAFMGNTSEGLSAIANGIKWKKGDGIIIPRPDFPTNVYPWINLERRGVKVYFIEKREGRVDMAGVKNALRPGVRLLSVSSVDFATGFRCDLEALGAFCAEEGLLFCVDAIQSLGAIPIDVKKCGIHFLASGGHKWLMSTMGSGALFICREVNDLVHPECVGWKSVVREEEFFRLQFDLKPDAMRFEPGTMNVAGIYALGAAIELIMEVGVKKIYDQILAINDLLLQGFNERKVQVISPAVAKERSGILSFIPSADPKSLHKFLTNEMIRISLRDHLIRISPHFYNNREDVARFFDALDKFKG